MTTRLGRRIASGVLAGLLFTTSGPFAIVRGAAAERAALGPLGTLSPPPDAAQRVLHAREAYGQLPLRFEANRGQSDARVDFLARGRGYALFLTATEAVLATPRDVLRMNLRGANPDSKAVGLEPLPGKANYFIGSDPARWRTNVPAYGRVEYRDVYPGIAIVYYGNQRQLEYDFVVAPGADPGAITLAFDGADRVETDDRGDLVLSTSVGEVRLKKPYVYQLVDGVRREVAGGWIHRASGVGFWVAAYDITRPLVIDPVLFYSTYLGGGSADSGRGIAVDGKGTAYVTGTTVSTNFPVTNGAYDTACGTDGNCNVDKSDVFVAKLTVDPATFKVSVSYATYIGGSDTDNGNAIAVDGAGNAYVTGATVSTNFPVTSGAFDMTCGTDGTCNGGLLDAFVAKLNPDGTALLYATYLGGNGGGNGFGIAVDSSGNAYVTGSFNDNNVTNTFPATSGAFAAVAFHHLQGFMVKLSTNDSKSNGPCTIVSPAETYNDCADLLYSTYLAADDDTEGFDIAVDSSGKVYVTGWTTSSLFPTKKAFQGAKAAMRDAFVMVLNPDNSNQNSPCNDLTPTPVQYKDCADLIYSTYLGGNGQDSDGFGQDLAIAVDSAGFIYVTGHTGAADFPGKGGVTAPKLGPGAKGKDAFVAKLDPNPSQCTAIPMTNVTCDESLVYSTYLGGTDDDQAYGIAVDHQGQAYVTGVTTSLDFPGPGNVAASRVGNNPPSAFGAFVAKLNAAGNALVYSTVLNDASSQGLALDASCNAYVTGQTSSPFSPGFPLINPLPPDFSANVGGQGDAFVTKIADFPFRAYVGNFDAGTVSVIDTQANAVQTTLTVGVNPEGIAVTPDGTKVYVTNLGASSVSVIDTRTNAVKKVTGTFQQPVGVAVHPGGKWAYVANSGVAFTPNARHLISVIDTATDTVVWQIELTIPDQANVPFGIAVRPQPVVGANDTFTRLYVTNLVGNFVSAIDIAEPFNPLAPSGSFLTKRTVGENPGGIAVSPDGALVYVANTGSGSVSIVKAENFSIGTEVLLDASSSPFGVAVHPAGHTVYVTDGAHNQVYRLTVSKPFPEPADVTKAPGSPIVVGNNPRGVAVTPDGALLYVANVSDNSVSIINTVGHKLLGDVPVGTAPVALGQFIGFPVFDKDGDGIHDLVDGFMDPNDPKKFVDKSDPADPSSKTNQSFTNKHLCGSVSGSIVAGSAAIEAFAGLVAKAGAAGATLKLCDFDTVMLAGGEVKPLTCGSLTAEVVVGPFQILLGSSGTATVPGGVTMRVAAVAGGFEVQNLAGPGTITVAINGQVMQVGPGSSGTFTPDSDGDGVPDDRDHCSGTPAGKKVDADGCSGEQRVSRACPCSGPSTGGTWKNHGSYVACVAREASGVARLGLITANESGAITSQAARSTCAVK